MSYCTIELSIGLILYLKDINPTTALICILKKESRISEGKEKKTGLKKSLGSFYPENELHVFVFSFGRS